MTLRSPSSLQCENASGGHAHDTACEARPGSLARRSLVGLVQVYQRVRAGRPSPCRFIPSCSTYAAEAIDSHGAMRGSLLALRRLSRCHPWGGQGYDPVPDRHGRDQKVN